jgi:hypothetical protein
MSSGKRLDRIYERLFGDFFDTRRVAGLVFSDMSPQQSELLPEEWSDSEIGDGSCWLKKNTRSMMGSSLFWRVGR